LKKVLVEIYSVPFESERETAAAREQMEKVESSLNAAQKTAADGTK
jgi:hypothetical protein